MNKQIALTALVCSLFSAGTVFAAAHDVCDVIRNSDSLSSTQRFAGECDVIAKSGLFDETAVGVCKAIAEQDSLSSTQRSAVACVGAIQNKKFQVGSLASCHALAVEDSLSSTQRKVIQCLNAKALALDAKSTTAPVPAATKPAVTSDPKSQLAVISVEGRTLSGSVEIIRAIEDGTPAAFIVIIKNAVIDGRSAGNVLLYPASGTEFEAKKVQAWISNAISTRVLDGTPITKFKISILQDRTTSLSEMTESKTAVDFKLGIGRIDISASGLSRTGSVQSMSIGYGVSFK